MRRDPITNAEIGLRSTMVGDVIVRADESPLSYMGQYTTALAQARQWRYTFWEVKPFGFEQIEPPKFVHDGGPDLMAYKMNPLWEALRDNVVANYEQRGLGSGWERHHSDPRPHFEVALATPAERKQILADDQAKRDAELKRGLTWKMAEVLETKLAVQSG